MPLQKPRLHALAPTGASDLDFISCPLFQSPFLCFLVLFLGLGCTVGRVAQRQEWEPVFSFSPWGAVHCCV